MSDNKTVANINNRYWQVRAFNDEGDMVPEKGTFITIVGEYDNVADAYIGCFRHMEEHKNSAYRFWHNYDIAEIEPIVKQIVEVGPSTLHGLWDRSRGRDVEMIMPEVEQ